MGEYDNRIVGNCPKCNARIYSYHEYSLCTECKEVLPKEILEKLRNSYASGRVLSGNYQNESCVYQLKKKADMAYFMRVRRVEIAASILLATCPIVYLILASQHTSDSAIKIILTMPSSLVAFLAFGGFVTLCLKLMPREITAPRIIMTYLLLGAAAIYGAFLLVWGAVVGLFWMALPGR
jgi:hypothetical protein